MPECQWRVPRSVHHSRRAALRVRQVRGAYDSVIRPYHSWLLRKTVDIVMTQLPSVEEAVGMFGPGLGDAERENKVFDEIQLYLLEGQPVVELLERIFADLGLEDFHTV